jgi:sugar/nucleoside kinase (ribokinase family)
VTDAAPLVVCLGEALVDFIAAEAGVGLGRARTYIKAPGGAMANTAAGLARLGVRSRFVGKAGSDAFGRFMIESLAAENVDVSCLIATDQYQTGIVFAALDQDRVPSYIFYGYPSADMMLSEDEVGPECLADAAFLHLGTVSMVREESRSASFKLMRLARENGVKISFDPNLRLHLWKDHGLLKQTALKAMAQSDLIKLNREELRFLTGEDNIETGAARLMEPGARAVAVTLGPEGAYYLCGDGQGKCPGFKMDVVDTTGAGDGFAAGLLVVLAEAKTWPPDKALLARATRFANAVGALVTAKLGAMTALPGRSEVEAFVKEREKEK